MDLNKLNLDNLIKLWKLSGVRSGNFLSKDRYDMSFVQGSDWPNRFWFTQTPPRDELKMILPQLEDSMTIPLWEENHWMEPHLHEAGFHNQFEQIAMYKELNGSINANSVLNINKVSDFQTAKEWGDIFSSAFGYKISTRVIMDTHDEVEYFIASLNNSPIGTAVLYTSTPNVVGIHSMGIVPEMRRNGYAEELLVYLLNKSYKKGIKYCFLQSSDMGKGLYAKLGFKEQFTIKNFKLNK